MKKISYLLVILVSLVLIVSFGFDIAYAKTCAVRGDCGENEYCDLSNSTSGGVCTQGSGLNIGEAFKINGNKGIGEATGYDSIGTFLSTAIIPNVMMVANIILFIMIFVSGFSVISSAGNPDKNKNAKAILTASIIGFVIIFAAYWIMEALGIIMGYDLFKGK